MPTNGIWLLWTIKRFPVCDHQFLFYFTNRRIIIPNKFLGMFVGANQDTFGEDNRHSLLIDPPILLALAFHHLMFHEQTSLDGHVKRVQIKDFPSVHKRIRFKIFQNPFGEKCHIGFSRIELELPMLVVEGPVVLIVGKFVRSLLSCFRKIPLLLFFGTFIFPWLSKFEFGQTKLRNTTIAIGSMTVELRKRVQVFFGFYKIRRNDRVQFVHKSSPMSPPKNINLFRNRKKGII